MNEEQKEKWYNSFTREQLIERCKYLQRSCERKEDSIMELEMENTDLEYIIKEVREYIKENFDKTCICVSGSDLLYSYIDELLEILDKVDKYE